MIFLDVTTSNLPNVTVNYTPPDPFWQQVVIAILPISLALWFFVFIFPRIARSMYSSRQLGKLEGYAPIKRIDKLKRKRKSIKHFLFSWLVRNGLLDLPEFDKKEELQ